MPVRKEARTARPRAKAKARAQAGPSHALLVIDHERLQGAAWAEFHAARKRLDRTARDLHRHEEIDTPAYEAWLHQTFPLQVTALRELNEELATKAHRIRVVQTMAARSGRSLKRLWQEEKERAAKPEAFRKKRDDEPEPDFDEGEERRRRTDAGMEDFERKPSAPRTIAARDIYRRLVQHLHPDRGGAWTPARERLWHEVQQAWTAGDGDWLARLEVEWETAHEAVGPKSPLSRLRAAIAELDAARRDIESKLRDYRTSLPWRFTLTAAKREALMRRVEAEFVQDANFLRRELKHLDAMIATWDDDWTRADSRPKPRRRRPVYRNTGGRKGPSRFNY